MLYPPSLFYLVFPLSWSLGVFNVAHLFFAGMGMYFLARRWTGNNFAAAVAGTAFAFNGLSWHMLMWISNLAAWAWMPWVVLLVERAWREGGKQIAVAGAAAAMQMLTGGPEIILMTWLFCGALGLGELFRSVTPRRKKFSRSVMVALLAAGLSAAQLLPFLDLLRHSYRDTSFNDSGWAMPADGLANFLEPLFHCFEAGHGTFVQHDQYWTASYYMGVGTLLLALAAICGVREWRVRLLALTLLASVSLALGSHGPVYAAIKAVLPQLNFIRYPIKFVALATFALPLLAGYAVVWHQKADTKPASSRNLFWTIAIILLGLLAVVLWVERYHPMPQDDWAAVWQNAVWRAAFLALTPALLLALRRVTERKLQVLLRGGLVLLLWLDIFTLAPEVNPTVARAVFEPGLGRVYANLPPQPVAGEPRVAQTAAAAERVRFGSFPKAEEDYLARRVWLYNNCNLIDDVPAIDGFYSLYPSRTEKVLGLLDDGGTRHVELNGLMDFLGVARVNLVSSDTGPLQWAGRTNFLPLVTAGQMPEFADDTNTLAKLAEPEFDPRKIVLLEPDAAAHLTARNRSDVKIASLQIAPEKMTMEVTAPAPAMVVVAQGFYHPWHAYVDGKRAELLRANFAFQAVEVPAGQHQLRFLYEDDLFRIGLALSIGTLAVCVWLWFRKSVLKNTQPEGVKTA